MVPGFQLVDRRFVLRWDATGHSPRHNLYTELLPRSRGSCTRAEMRFFALAALMLLARSTAAMSVDAAYASIPHRRTVFDRRAATMSADEADGLDRLFALVDNAIVARVTKSGHDTVLADLRALELPERLRRVQTLVTEAVVAERAYLADGSRPPSRRRARGCTQRTPSSCGSIPARTPTTGTRSTTISARSTSCSAQSFP